MPVQKWLGRNRVDPRVAATRAKVPENTTCQNSAIAPTNTPTTRARAKKTRARRGSHVSKVVIVLLVQSAPPSDAPSATPSRITKVEIPWMISSRSRSRTPLRYGPTLARQ
jgi:hypothetical protein